jgi:hypothetical protein
MADSGGSDKAYAGRMIATAAAILSLIATGLGGYGTWSAERAKEKADQTQAELDRSKLIKDYQLKVFEMIDKSLSDTQGSLVLASAYVSSIDDPKVQGDLSKAIRVVAEVRYRLNKLTPEEAEALQLLKADTRNADLAEAAATQSASAPAAAPVANPLSDNGVASPKVNQADINPIGWDVDVFWCDGRGEASKSLAAAVAKDLAAKADSRTPVSGAYLGLVRLRQLTDAAASQGNLPSRENAVLGDSGEETLADALAGLASAKGSQPFVRKPSGSNSRWYLSVFACGA